MMCVSAKIRLKFLRSNLRIKLIFLLVLAASCASGLLALLPGIAKSLPIVAAFIPPFPPFTTSTVLFPFGSLVRTVAITPDGSRLYVANGWNNTVSVIDVLRNEVIDIVHVFPEPNSIAIAPDGSKVYVACPDTQIVAVLDAGTNKLIKAIDIETEDVLIGPTGITIMPDGSKAYVTNTGLDEFGPLGQTVSVIDMSIDEVIRTITVGLEPVSLVITQDGSRAYVTNVGSNSVTVIDTATDTVIGVPIDVGSAPVGIAITPDDSKVYVTTPLNNTVSVIRVSTNEINTIPAESLPVVILISPDGSRAYVTNVGSNSVTVIDTATDTVIGEPIDVGPNPIGIAITGDSSKVYVANQGTLSDPGNTVSAIDISTGMVTEIPLTQTNVFSPIALGITDFRVYVASIHTIDVIDISTDEVIETIPAGGSGPTRIAITPDGIKAYIANSGRGTVSVIDVPTDEIIKTIEVGSQPVDIEITPDGAKALVANLGLRDKLGGNTVSVIRTSDDQVIATIEVGSQPVDIEITPDGAKALVANFQDGSISVIDVSINSVITPPIVIGDLVPEAGGLQPSDIEIADPDGPAGPDNPRAYVVTNDVIVTIDVLTNEIDTINLQEFPVSESFKAVSVSITPDGSGAYVANNLDGSVSVINVQANEVIDKIDKVGPGPAFIGITLDPDGPGGPLFSKAYVVISGSEFFGFEETGETVSVIDVEKNMLIDTDPSTPGIIDPITVGVKPDSKPVGIAVTPDGAKVLVPNYFDNTVSIINTSDNSVTNMDVGVAPTDVAITPDGNKAYITNSVSRTVSVIDVSTNSAVKTINVDAEPDQVGGIVRFTGD